MRLSRFGESCTKKSGILELMEDLGRAMADRHRPTKLNMLGGGNPAILKSLVEVFAAQLSEIVKEPGRLDRMFGHYGLFPDSVGQLNICEQYWEFR